MASELALKMAKNGLVYAGKLLRILKNLFDVTAFELYRHLGLTQHQTETPWSKTNQCEYVVAFCRVGLPCL
jgi:hypothetical protein